MSETIYRIVGNDISDGFHTFGELYDHRCLLWILLVLNSDFKNYAYWLKDHYEGWDGIVVQHPQGQLSYHVSVKFRHLYESKLLLRLEKNHVYDGHTSADVLKRLEAIIK